VPTTLSRSTVSLLGFAFAAVWIASGLLAALLCLLSATAFAVAVPRVHVWYARRGTGTRLPARRSRREPDAARVRERRPYVQDEDDVEPEVFELPREQYGW
jgi:hypothetical protein